MRPIIENFLRLVSKGRLPLKAGILSLCISFLFWGSVHAQCTDKGTQNADSPFCVGINTSGVDATCTTAGQYATFDELIPGEEYIAETCGDTDFDSYLTVFEGGTSTVLGYNNDDCGTQSRVTFTAPSNGEVDVGLREYAVGTNSACGCQFSLTNWSCGFLSRYRSCNYTCSTTNSICMTITVRKVDAQSTPAPTGDDSGCPGSEVLLARPSVPPSNLIYYWQTSDTGTSTASSGATYTVSTSGTYYLRGRDDCGNWATVSTGKAVTFTGISTTITLTENSGNTTDDGLVCYGDNATLDAGTGFSSYAWSTSASSQSITVPGGTYTVTVEDGNGCTATASATVSENPQILAATCKLADPCQQDEGQITLQVSGGTGPYIFAYAPMLIPGITETNNGNEYILSNIPGGTTLTVSVTDSEGCTP